MARLTRVHGEKPLFWVGPAKNDLLDFPEAAKDEIGVALSVAQFGGKHPKAKPWKGEGPGVFEIVEDNWGDTYRAVYTVRFSQAVMFFMPSKRNRRRESRQPGRTWSWFPEG